MVKLEIVCRDLFTAPDDYYLVHCISSDLNMGLGIATQFQKQFKVRGKIKKARQEIKHPDAVLTGRVFNLITKKSYWNKPTYNSLEASLLKMKTTVKRLGIKKIASPKIGCGLDRLQWPRVREMIKQVFSDMDIEWTIYFL